MARSLANPSISLHPDCRRILQDSAANQLEVSCPARVLMVGEIARQSINFVAPERSEDSCSICSTGDQCTLLSALSSMRLDGWRDRSPLHQFRCILIAAGSCRILPDPAANQIKVSTSARVLMVGKIARQSINVVASELAAESCRILHQGSSMHLAERP